MESWVAFTPLEPTGENEPLTLCPIYHRDLSQKQILPTGRVLTTVNFVEIKPGTFLLNRFVIQKTAEYSPPLRCLDPDLDCSFYLKGSHLLSDTLPVFSEDFAGSDYEYESELSEDDDDEYLRADSDYDRAENLRADSDYDRAENLGDEDNFDNFGMEQD